MNVSGVRRGSDTVAVPDARVAEAAGTPSLNAALQTLAAKVEAQGQQIEVMAGLLSVMDQRLDALEGAPPPEPEPGPDPEPPPSGDYVAHMTWPDPTDVTSGVPRAHLVRPASASMFALRVVPMRPGWSRPGNLLAIHCNAAAEYGNVQLDDQIPVRTRWWMDGFFEYTSGFTTNHGFAAPYGGTTHPGGQIQIVPFAFKQEGVGFRFFSGTKFDHNWVEFPDPFRWGFTSVSVFPPGLYRVRLEVEIVQMAGAAEVKMHNWPELYAGHGPDAPLVASADTMEDSFWDVSKRLTLREFNARHTLGGNSADLARRFSMGQESNTGFPANGLATGWLYQGDTAFSVHGPPAFDR